MAGGGRSITRGGSSSRGISDQSSPRNNDIIMNDDIATDSRVANVDGKILIEPDGNTFKPNPTNVVHSIRDIFQRKFERAWPTWTNVDINVRDMWFEEFKKYYYWHPQHANKIRANFEARGKKRLSDTFAEARKKLARDSNYRPNWLTLQVWDGLKALWISDDFKRKSDTAKANRSVNTGVGTSLHTGGSIPTSEIRRRLEKEKGEKICQAELFLHTHQRKGNKEWVDDKASRTYESFVSKWQDIQLTQTSDRESAHNGISDTDVWVKEFTTKKGGVYGLGSEVEKYKSACSSGSVGQATQNVPPSSTIEEVNEQIQKALDEQNKKHEESRQEQRQMLQKALEDQDKKNEERLQEAVAGLMKDIEKKNKLFKKSKKKSKNSSEKTKVSSHNSVAGKEKSLRDDTSSN